MLCCVEHKIDPDPTSINVTSHKSGKVQCLLGLSPEDIYRCHRRLIAWHINDWPFSPLFYVQYSRGLFLH